MYMIEMRVGVCLAALMLLASTAYWQRPEDHDQDRVLQKEDKILPKKPLTADEYINIMMVWPSRHRTPVKNFSDAEPQE